MSLIYRFFYFPGPEFLKFHFLAENYISKKNICFNYNIWRYHWCFTNYCLNWMWEKIVITIQLISQNEGLGLKNESNRCFSIKVSALKCPARTLRYFKVLVKPRFVAILLHKRWEISIYDEWLFRPRLPDTRSEIDRDCSSTTKFIAEYYRSNSEIGT